MARASLVWKIRQGERWIFHSEIVPPETGSRLVCQIIREFSPHGGKRAYTPRDFDVTEPTCRRVSYQTDGLVVRLRWIQENRK